MQGRRDAQVELRLRHGCPASPEILAFRLDPLHRRGSPSPSPSLARIRIRRILAIPSSRTCAASFSFTRAPPRRRTPSRARIRSSPPPPCVPCVVIVPCLT
nr:uncharacterized protein LOC109780392 isoform X2 [Aegilops tauschii subsp. strangulata]